MNDIFSPNSLYDKLPEAFLSITKYVWIDMYQEIWSEFS
jgi:hypothetical protein